MSNLLVDCTPALQAYRINYVKVFGPAFPRILVPTGPEWIVKSQTPFEKTIADLTAVWIKCAIEYPDTAMADEFLSRCGDLAAYWTSFNATPR